MQDNAYGQREIQEVLLSMTKEIDAVCRKHGIRYTLGGGSMLGAIREKGFIPWDDDVDLIFTREELKRFVEVFPRESERCTVTLLDTWVARVITREPINGETPFVDLFHFDWLPIDPKTRARKLLLTRMLMGMLKERTDYSRFSRRNRMLLKTTRAMGFLFPRRWKIAWMERVTAWGSPEDDMLHISNATFDAIAIEERPDCIKGYHDTPFEDAMLMISDDWDAMLRAQYGDNYMTPPPESARKPQHEAQHARRQRKAK